MLNAFIRRTRNVAALTATALLLLTARGNDHSWREATPGYDYSFPRDHGSHPNYKIEWWYYTGNLRAADGRRFGYQLTFFRSGINLRPASKSRWAVRDLFIAHFAVSDLDHDQFYFFEKLNRAGVSWAGVDADGSRIWNDGWEASVTSDAHVLHAEGKDVKLDLRLVQRKAPVIHGSDGVSQKGSQEGNASHYYSLTRLDSAGTIKLKGKRFDVKGTSWMDHEFGTSFLEEDDVGWDWLYVQLEDNRELMLFVIRRKDGNVSPHSSGTLIDPSGRTRGLSATEFTLRPVEKWASLSSGATYPVHWEIVVPGERLKLTVEAAMNDQELRTTESTGLAYWEGSTHAKGIWGDEKIKGVGYLEMTGYTGRSMASVFR